MSQNDHIHGEVQEIIEESPEISSIHIGEEEEKENGEKNGRNRTESMNSVNSESWQTNDEMLGKLRRAQSLLDQGMTPLQIITLLFPNFNVSGITMMSERAHLAILSDLLERGPSRQKLPQFNSLSDAVELFRTRKNILVLTGAGVSVSCGIPDFRSKDGIYARLRSEFPDLPDPTAMFDIRYFRSNPAPFYNFAREIFPGQFVPSISHRFIKQLESTGQLLRNYTQNIDTLEHQTGIRRVVECHGSFSKCTCTQCLTEFDGDHIRDEVLRMTVPRCSKCQGVIKPNIVFFGEDLARDFHRKVTEDKAKVDLIVVIGSSLKVRPVALIPHCVSKDVPQILINRESLPHYHADIELLGNCDDIIRDISYALGEEFAKMIRDYDKAITDKKLPTSCQKRALISQEEFLKKCLEVRSGSTDKATDKATDDMPPCSKRPRLQFETPQTHKEDDEDTRSSDEVLRSIKAPRLLDITELLTDNRCVAISPYQTVFPGAECSFDLETMKLVREQAPSTNSSSTVSEAGSEAGSETVSNPLSRTQSFDEIYHAEVIHRSVSTEGIPIRRAESCDSDLQYDLSEVINPQTFTNLCEEFRHSHF